MKKPRLIASDLDGTLLLHGAQQLNPEACGLIQQVLDQGIFFAAASGRQYFNLQNLFSPVRDQIAYLCENGCLSYYHDEILNREVMDRELGRRIIRMIEEDPACEPLVSGTKTSYIRSGNPSYYSLLHDVVRDDVTIVPDLCAIEEPYMKISIYTDSVERILPDWQRKAGSFCTVATGGSQWLDMMPAGVNKSTALRKIMERLGVEPEDCIAFGDNDNDREMLEMVGCPIVMDTAVPSVRPLGRYHTDTVEHALQRILSGEGFD